MTITRSVLLACGAAEAFALFTEQAGEWWPENRRHTKDPRSEIRITAAGRFYERASDGREVDLGWVREFVAPERLVLDFYVGTGPAEPTEVTVTFAAAGEDTRVTIEHRPLPASEEVWKQRAPLFLRSWDAVLEALGARAPKRE